MELLVTTQLLEFLQLRTNNCKIALGKILESFQLFLVEVRLPNRSHNSCRGFTLWWLKITTF
jgi:hypothetical protein